MLTLQSIVKTIKHNSSYEERPLTDVTLAPDEHSGIVGGSSASRILGCPGSYDLYQKLQEQLDVEADQLIIRTTNDVRSGKIGTEAAEALRARAEKRAEKLRDSLAEASEYADEGTKLHKVLAYIVDNDLPIDTLAADPVVDQMFEELEIDDDRFFDCVVPAYRQFLAVLDEVYDEDPDAEIMIRVESRVDFPGIDDAFGTCDVLIRAPKKTIVWDWKFGAGVPVYASYKAAITPVVSPAHEAPQPIENEVQEFGNDQLMFYARAALETHPEYFGPEGRSGLVNWPVELIICQPRLLPDEPSRFTVKGSDLEAFRLDLVDAVDEALSGKGQLKIGSYCRFAKCKAICPLHLNGPTAMVEVGSKLAKLQALHSLKTTGQSGGAAVGVEQAGSLTYPQALAAMLDLKDIVEPYILEAEAQAHAFMEAGGEIPGRKLVAKKPGWDSWKDDKKAEQYLSRQGIPLEVRRVVKPMSPAKARDYLKAQGGFDEKAQKQLAKYVQPGVSSGFNIVPSDDPRPAIQSTPAAMQALAAKIGSVGQ